MKKLSLHIPTIIVYFFALLFCYAAISKLMDFENFQVQLAQSPLLSAYAGFVSYAIIIIEMATTLLLCFSKTRLSGLYASLGLMCGFTIYIYLILNYSDFVPCSCGGILEKLGWHEHLIFNIGCVILALFGIFLVEKQQPDRKLKPVLYTSSVSILSCAFVIGLFMSSEYIIKKDNNFTRRFLLHPLEDEDAKIDLGLNSYYFAGTDDNYIYLGNVTAPLLFTKVDKALNSSTSTRLVLDRSDYKYRNLQLQVKAPYYYLCDGSVPIIYRGIIGDSLAHTISYDDAYFTQIAIMDTTRFALRTRSKANMQYTLALLDLNDSEKIHLKPEILEKQIDGVFDVDGRLVANQTVPEYTYTYTYRNQFIVMDSNLNVLRRLNTIDTTRVAKISQMRLSNGTHKMDAPPLKVNINSTLNRSLLFNESNLMGKNESRKSWQKASIADIYRTDVKEYIGSFYIYHKKGEKMSQMLAIDNYLYVLIGNDLIRFRFRDNITKFFIKKQGKPKN